MSGRRRKYTLEFGEQAAGLVIESAGRWRMWLPRSVWANRCWRVGCASNARAASAGDNWRRCRTPMNTLSWSGYAVRAELCWPTHLLSDPEHVESQLSS